MCGTGEGGKSEELGTEWKGNFPCQSGHSKPSLGGVHAGLYDGEMGTGIMVGKDGEGLRGRGGR